MKPKAIITGLAVLFLAAMFPAAVNAQPRVALRLEFGGRGPSLNSFYVSLGNYYDVPYGDICVMHDAGVVDDDIPVILYIYRHSPYSLRQIYSLRLNGATWDNLSNWCGVPLYRTNDRDYIYRGGPPYGKAYGYYQHGPGSRRDDGNGYYGKSHGKHRGHDRDDD